MTYERFKEIQNELLFIVSPEGFISNHNRYEQLQNELKECDCLEEFDKRYHDEIPKWRGLENFFVGVVK